MYFPIPYVVVFISPISLNWYASHSIAVQVQMSVDEIIVSVLIFNGFLIFRAWDKVRRLLGSSYHVVLLVIHVPIKLLEGVSVIEEGATFIL